MTDKPLYTRIEQISDHGSDQGIVTRFILQMQEIAKFAFLDENERNIRMGKYTNVVIIDFTSFYDLYQEVKEIFENYKVGVLNGEYFKIDDRGIVRINRSMEQILKTKIKDFFIHGRLLINNWAKSKAIDDDSFCLNDLLIVSEPNFLKNKKALLNNDDLGRYEHLFNVIENSRNSFLTTFSQIRADIEHSNFNISKFKFELINGQIIFEQPKLRGKNLMELLDYYYTSLFDFIEVIMVYYLGINAFYNYEGMMTLCKRKVFNYKELKFKYLIATGFNDPNLTALII